MRGRRTFTKVFTRSASQRNAFFLTSGCSSDPTCNVSMMVSRVPSVVLDSFAVSAQLVLDRTPRFPLIQDCMHGVSDGYSVNEVHCHHIARDEGGSREHPRRHQAVTVRHGVDRQLDETQREMQSGVKLQIFGYCLHRPCKHRVDLSDR